MTWFLCRALSQSGGGRTGLLEVLASARICNDPWEQQRESRSLRCAERAGGRGGSRAGRCLLQLVRDLLYPWGYRLPGNRRIGGEPRVERACCALQCCSQGQGGPGVSVGAKKQVLVVWRCQLHRPLLPFPRVEERCLRDCLPQVACSASAQPGRKWGEGRGRQGSLICVSF